MRASVRRLGNSSGVIIPKSFLAEAGLSVGDAVDMILEEGRITLSPIKVRPRAGWSEVSKALADAGDDALVWPEFANADDAAIEW